MAIPESYKECMKRGYCKDKSGLPLFVVRYGTATRPGTEGKFFEKGAAYHGRHNLSESNAPELSGDFHVPENIPLGDCTFYTLRMLRVGFLYTFDEARQRWQQYFVTFGGFLIPFSDPYHGQMNAPHDAERKPCLAHNYAKASYITVPDPDNATNLWLCFSDVEWSKDVFDRHTNPAYRARHMQKFDVKAWLGALKAPHAGRIADLARHVADFAEGVNEAAFGFSPTAQGHHAFPLLARSGGLFWKTQLPELPTISQNDLSRLTPKEQAAVTGAKNADGSPAGPMHLSAAAQLIAESERILPGKGAFVALVDAPGIAQELAELMAWRIEAFDKQARYERKQAASANIQMFKKFIFDKTDAKTVELIGLYENPEAPGYIARPWELRPDPLSEEETKKILKEGREDAWKGYTTQNNGQPRFEEDARAAFQQDYDTARAEYAQTVIGPMAEAHVRWMQSETLAEFFICNFSTENPYQGGQYTNVLSLCIGDTQDKSACAQLYEQWMDGSLGDEKNLLLRAFILNQDEQAEAIDRYREALTALQAQGQALYNSFPDVADDALPVVKRAPAEPDLVAKLIAFTDQWVTLKKDIFEQVDKPAASAFGILRNDPPPPNSPLGRLIVQTSAPAFAALQKIDLLENTPFSTLFALQNHIIPVPARITGQERDIAALTMRTLAYQTRAIHRLGNWPLELLRLTEIYGAESGAIKVAGTRLMLPSNAIIAPDNLKTFENMASTDQKLLLGLMIGKPLEFQATRLPSLFVTHEITRVYNLKDLFGAARTNVTALERKSFMDQLHQLFRGGEAQPALYGGANLILSALVMASTWHKLDKKTEWDSGWETGSRFAAATTAFIGSSANMAVKSLEVAGKIADQRGRFAQVTHLILANRGLRWLSGSWMGAPTGIVGAYWDYVGLRDATKKEDWVLMGAYGGSMALNAAPVVFLLLSRFFPWITSRIPHPVAWAMLVASFVFSQGIETMKDDRYKKYLEKCAFGSAPEGKWVAADEIRMFLEAAE